MEMTTSNPLAKVLSVAALLGALVGLWITISGCEPPVTGVDPKISWTKVTTDCLGNAATTVNYNVYLIPGPTVPTVSVSNIPCGTVTQVDHTKATPANSAPLACATSPCSFTGNLAEGTYTAAVESLAADGTPGGVSNTVTFVVKVLPAPASGVTVSP